MKRTIAGVAVFIWGVAALAGTCIVRDGVPLATVVLAEEATPVERLAAEEIVLHLQRMSGARVPTGTAGTPGSIPIYIGSAARAVGVTASELTLEHYRVVVTPAWVAVAGRDGSRSDKVDDPLNIEVVQTGTLFGVYHLLDNVLGVRWLWPGERGTFVPEQRTVVLAEMDVTAGPRLLQRQLRHHRARARRVKMFAKTDGLRKLADEMVDRQDREERLWLRRQRMGRREQFAFGHAFSRWWRQYGESHPEYFATLPGRKQPFPNAERPKLCVSNSAVTDRIIADWQAAGASSHLAACPNDSRAFCTCENCRAWDLPEVTTPENVDGSVLTYRYVRFWRVLAERVAAINPDVFVCGYAYSNYRTPPEDVKLPSNVFLGYVGGMGDAAMEEWRQWAAAGVKLYFRPNWFHGGHNAPYMPLRESAEFLAFASRNSMLGTDFDSLLGHYATHGPWYYVVVRAQARPELSVDSIIGEYCSAFGPASAHIRRYLQYWEQHTVRYREAILEHSEEMRGGSRAAMRLMPELFGDDVLGPAEELLASALSVAGSQPEAAERVRFLSLGLRHVALTRDAVRYGADVGSARGVRENALKAVAAAKELLAFRRSIEDTFVDWTEYTTHREISLGDFTGIRLASVLGDREPIAVLPASWYFRFDPDDAGEREGWHKREYDPRRDKWPKAQVYRWWESNAVGKKWREEHGKDYDGVAWYRVRFKVPGDRGGRRFLLLFGAVDEACKVWLNGQLVGEHPYVEPDDWKTPFEFDVTEQLVDGSNHVAVRVVDNAGAGGIWKLVWLLAE